MFSPEKMSDVRDSDLINSELSFSAENAKKNQKIVRKANARINKIQNYKARIEKPDLEHVQWKNRSTTIRKTDNIILLNQPIKLNKEEEKSSNFNYSTITDMIKEIQDIRNETGVKVPVTETINVQDALRYMKKVNQAKKEEEYLKEDEYLNGLQCKEVKNENSDSDSDGSI